MNKVNKIPGKWRVRLHKIYSDFEEFQAYDAVYNIGKRLGFRSIKTLWEENPIIEGSVNPKDLRIYKGSRQ